jgi:hypothetical protein
MPQVWNKRDPNCPKDAIYVGRPTKWGNPFSHILKSAARYLVPTREDAVAAFETSFLNDPRLIREAKDELKGRDLVCWCVPSPCHANVLLRIANED